MRVDIYKVAYDNLYMGFDLGVAAVAGSKVAEKFPIVKYPFTNRALDVGCCNILSALLIDKVPYPNFLSFSNFLHRGLVQGNKWVPNFYIQSLVRDNCEDFYLIKQFKVIYSGMTPFFTVGAIDAAITNPYAKMTFTLSTAAVIAIFPYYDNYNQTTVTEKKAIYLSPQDSHSAQWGLVASHAVVDLMKYFYPNGFVKDKTILYKLTAATYVAVEGYKVVIEGQTISTVVDNFMLDSVRVIAFSLARSTGFTLVELVKQTPKAISYVADVAIENPYTAIGVVGLSMILAFDQNPIDYLGSFMIDRDDFLGF